MKKVLKSLALTGSLLAVAATAQAFNSAQVTTTSPAIVKSGCERIGSVTFTFDQGTSLQEGDWFYMDLPANTSICSTIDYMIAAGRSPGAAAHTITYPSVVFGPLDVYLATVTPIPALAPLFFPIEVIGHFARVLSLTLRLFGNIMGEDLVLAILLFLAGMFLAPLPMMFLAVFTSLVQAFVFTLLSMMYFAGSMEHAH